MWDSEGTNGVGLSPDVRGDTRGFYFGVYNGQIRGHPWTPLLGTRGFTRRSEKEVGRRVSVVTPLVPVRPRDHTTIYKL